MGDNDFTAGDPWGLPIEESEEFELAESPVEDETLDTEPESPEEDGTEEPFATADDLETEAVDIIDHAGEDLEAVPEQEPGFDQPVADSVGSEWWSSAGSADQPEEAVDSSVAEDEEPPVPEDEDTPAPDSEGDQPEDEEYTFKAPVRTPLSQMIAAAQSVVSSVQGDQPGDAEEDESSEGVSAGPDVGEPEDSATVVPEIPAEDVPPSADDLPAGDDDLPDEPPAWLIVDSATEPEPAEPAEDHESVEIGADQSFTPEDIEASIVELASPETTEAPFAEDQFEMPEEKTDAEFADVDMDSSPGVYSELHDLADQDEQAEALLQEAAEAFGHPDQTPPFDEVAGEIPGVDGEPPEEIDSFAEALATEFETTETPLEITDDTVEEPLQELEDTTADAEEIDSFAEALATEFETTETPLEITDDTVEEPLQELEDTTADAEEIDSFAEALATELETTETPQESDAIGDVGEGPQEPGGEYLSDAELGQALAGLGESPDVVQSDELTDFLSESAEEASPSTGIDDFVEPAASVFTDDGSLEGPEPESIPESVIGVSAWDDQEPPISDVAPIEGLTEEESEPSADEVKHERVEDEAEAVSIDSPVAWGTRYREAHQGWIEDDEGRSTWRPIVTSGESVAGWDIDIYLGMVTSDVAIEPQGYGALAGEVAEARERAGRRMLDEALARGAHAVVGVTYSIQEVTGTVLVTASGVAVTLRTPA